MVSEAQKRLAHFIASKGIRKYTDVVQLMEQRNPFVESLKRVAQMMQTLEYNPAPHSGFEQSVEAAYLVARFASEFGVRDWSSTFVMGMLPERHEKQMTKLMEQLKDLKAGLDMEELRQRYLAERESFMAERRTLCMKDDPYASETVERH